MIGHTGEIWALALTPDSRTILSGAMDRSARLWAIDGDRQANELRIQRDYPIGITSDGTQLLALDADSQLFVWNLNDRTSNLVGRIADAWESLAAGSTRGGHFTSVSAHADLFAFGMKNGTVRVWDFRARQFRKDVLVEPEVPVEFVAFHPITNEILATATQTGSVKLWNVRTRQLLHTLPAPLGSISALCLSPTDDIMGICSVQRSLKGSTLKFQVRRLGVTQELFSFDGNYGAAQFSPNGKYLAAASDKGRVVLYEVQTGRVAAQLNGYYAGVDSLCFSPDGRTLASASNDETVKLWHVQTGTEMMTINSSGQLKVMFSPSDERASLVISGLYSFEPVQIVHVSSLRAIDVERH